MRHFGVSAAVLSLAATALASPVASSALPIVNLGYERHQAISFNSTGGYYNFSNIRYAEPPVGALRFAAPVAVSGQSSAIDNGSVGRVCAQADPAWLVIAEEFIPAYLTGQPFNLSAAEAALLSMNASSYPTPDPRTTEDCLFLDVYTPKKVYDDACSTGGAPVMVWIYGGGYTNGEKNGGGQYDPAGIIHASQVTGNDGVIFVALNYRLGAFGWLSGPTLQSNGTANAGLYDQRLALEWVQTNIHLFGGDPKRVTVFGESAGGGSIVHQITAFGGLNGPVPFAQAIPQSAAWQLVPSSYQQEQVFQAFLALLNVSTIEEARQLPSAALIKANTYQVLTSPYGDFGFGPVVDGLFAPALPGRLLLQGSFHKNVKIMVGHNADEGLLFTNPAITNDTAYDTFLATNFPDIQPAVAAYVENVLYPPVFTGAYGYTSDFQRAVLTLADSTFTCNTYYLDRAFLNRTFAYQFSVGAALHGQDVPYTFFNGPVPGTVLNDTIAIALQEYITSFAINGVPSGPGIPMFPMYGAGAEEINLNATTISEMVDSNANARCLWWQKALYF
ncbi:hypothetical protein MMC19_004171 [Ptychographa xylographoides]|nr:hypothetical protein [Ptychographa xylographoides]